MSSLSTSKRDIGAERWRAALTDPVRQARFNAAKQDAFMRKVNRRATHSEGAGR